MPVHPFPPGADGYSEERLCITLLSTLVATELKVRPVDCSPSVLEAVLFPCCTSSCASQGPFGALGLLRGGERTWCAGLVPFGVVFARRGHSHWSARRRGRLQLLLWLEGGGGGRVHVRLAETTGQRRCWMSMQCRPPTPFSKQRLSCAHL